MRKYTPTYAYLSTSFAASASAGGSGSSTGAAASLVTRDFHISFYNMPLVSSIRDLRMDRVGQLVSISGTVTRTSEVRPELVSGTFRCEACAAVVSDVEQQFKYTEVREARGAVEKASADERVASSPDPASPSCARMGPARTARRGTSSSSRASLATGRKSASRKTPTRYRPGVCRARESARRGSRLSCAVPADPAAPLASLDVILRADTVERAKAGDKCNFTGTFIVVPDVSQLGIPGVNAEMQRQAQGGRREQGGVASQGVTGLKALGVRDLQYKTAFLACTVQQADARVGPHAGGCRGRGTPG